MSIDIALLFWSLPLYLGGIFMIRSLVWCVSAIGLGIMFVGVLF